MSIISDALLQQFMEQGIPVLIVPASAVEDESMDEDNPFTEAILPRRKKKKQGLFFGPSIPSPVPG